MKVVSKNILARALFIVIIAINFIIDTAYTQNGFVWSEPMNIEILNSEANEFAPSWNKYEQFLYFNSDKYGYSEFYITEYKADMGFTKPFLAKGSINKSKNNQSYISFIDQNEAVFSSYRMTEKRPYLNLHSCKRKKNEWGETSTINELAGDFFAAHPTISPDGKTMIFSTTMESEKGDTDLWAAYLQDDKTWSQPVFISELNTSGNEITPFLVSEDTLFFASNGQGGPGGYDIFYSVKSKGLWQKPYPLSGLNTEYNESDFIIIQGNLAVFSSDRPGGKGGLDLWSAFLETEEAPKQEYLADFELSIALQASSIKTHRDLLYNQFYIPNIIRIDTNYKVNSNKTNVLSVACNAYHIIDSVYKNKFSILAEQFRNSNNKVIVTSFGDNPEIRGLTENILTIFEKNFDISRHRFIVQNIKNINTKSMYLSFQLDGDVLSSFYKLGKDSISMMPPVVELSIDARPRRLMKSWLLETILNNDLELSDESGEQVPARVITDLRQHECDLAYSDSVVFNITGLDSLSRKAKEHIKLPVIHTISEKAEIIVYGNIEYYSYFILIFEPIFLEKYGYYNEFFDHVKSKYQKGKNVILHDFSYFNGTSNRDQINEDISCANALSALLKEKCQVSENDIELVRITDNKKIMPFSNDLKPYVVQLLIQK